MTKFALIYPESQSVHVTDCADEKQALRLAGLQPGHVDHGVVAYHPKTGVRVGIIVFEFSLFIAPEKQKYFALGRQLFGGNAVLYAESPKGNLLNLDDPPLVQWLPSAAVAERNIQLGLLDRPEMSVNNVVTWQWPQERKS